MKTRAEEVRYEQNMLAIKYGKENLSWWYGTKCEKCCGVFPKLMKRDVFDKYNDTYYQCEVCGKQTDYYGMPWVAEEAWNEHRYMGEGVQLSFI